MEPQVVIGVDIGGTRIKSAVVSVAGETLDESVRATPRGLDGGSLGPVVADVVDAHRRRLGATASTPGAVGLVIPGIVDDRAGRGVYSANLGWRDLDVHGSVSPSIGLPLAVGHDVRAGLVAEHRFGAARSVDDVLFLPLGTGIAAAVLIGGQLLRNPWSGELGHVSVDPAGPRCRCGGRGCLETVASARAIARRHAERTAGPGTADAAEVARLVADSTDHGAAAEAARAVWSEAVDALAATVAPVVAGLGTQLVLVGGGLVRSGETLLRPLRAAVARRLGAGLGVEVRAAELGDRAGSLGAAALALELIGR